MATRCCCPPEQLVGQMVFAPLQPQGLYELGQPFLVHRSPVQRHGKRHVLHHVEHGDEVVELIHDAHLAPAQHGQFLVVARIHVVAVEEYGARRRPVDASHEVQQRRLARSGRPHDGDEFPSGHAERHVVQSPGCRRPRTVHLGEMLNGQYVHGSPFFWSHVRRPVCAPRTFKGMTSALRNCHLGFAGSVPRLPPSRAGTANAARTPAAPRPPAFRPLPHPRAPTPPALPMRPPARWRRISIAAGCFFRFHPSCLMCAVVALPIMAAVPSRSGLFGSRDGNPRKGEAWAT